MQPSILHASNYIQATPLIPLSEQTWILSILLWNEKKKDLFDDLPHEPGWREGVEQGLRPQVVFTGRRSSENVTRRTSGAAWGGGASLRPSPAIATLAGLSTAGWRITRTREIEGSWSGCARAPGHWRPGQTACGGRSGAGALVGDGER
jgi:hypothetical protein